MSNLPVIRADLERMTPEFSKALPSHMPPDRFKRTAMTAIQSNPQIARCDARSVIGAVMRAAQDGLMPDGREGAIVPFKDQAQWMPMAYGIIKKLRQSGEVASIVTRCVYANDAFKVRYGDEEGIDHTPELEHAPGDFRAVYAIVRLSDGTIEREVMTKSQVDQVRASSRASGSGPWTNWYDEMARKTVLRRISKRLPMSSDLEQWLKKEDAEDVASERAEARKMTRLEALEEAIAPAGHDEDGVVIDADAVEDAIALSSDPDQWTEAVERLQAACAEANDVPAIQGLKEVAAVTLADAPESIREGVTRMLSTRALEMQRAGKR